MSRRVARYDVQATFGSCWCPGDTKVKGASAFDGMPDADRSTSVSVLQAVVCVDGIYALAVTIEGTGSSKNTVIPLVIGL